MKRILIYMTTISLLTSASLATGRPIHAQDNGLPIELTGTEWKLLEIQRSTQDVLSTANTNVTLTFDIQGLARGNSACNSYSAPYQTGAGQALTLGDLVSTLRACVDTSLMDLETEYYRALQDVMTYSFDGATLQLFYNNGPSVLKFGAASIPGMPKTGGLGANHPVFPLAGSLLVLFGVVFLASVQITRHKHSEQP